MPNVDRALLTSLCAALIIGLIPTAPVQAADVSSVVVNSGHSGIVNGLAVAPDGRWMVTGADDSTVRLWDVRSRPQIGYAVLACAHAQHRCHPRRLRVVLVLEAAPNLTLEA